MRMDPWWIQCGMSLAAFRLLETSFEASDDGRFVRRKKELGLLPK